MSLYMKALKYFFRRYFLDILTTIVALILVGITYHFSKDPKVSFLWRSGITLVAAFMIIYFRVKERAFYFESLHRRKHQDNWVGYGTFEYSRMDRCFRITDSDSGFLFTKTLNWSDYELRFRFKILTSCLGVIIRAVNLSNLVMLQIGQSGIRPHIWVNGLWKAWEISEVALEFKQSLDTNEWYGCKIKCDKDNIRVWIGQRSTLICDKAWKIPRGQMNFVLEKGKDGASDKVIPFSINLEYGTVGFRNDKIEEALIRDVYIQKIA